MHVTSGKRIACGERLVSETCALVKPERGHKARIRDERDPVCATLTRKIETSLHKLHPDAAALRGRSNGEFAHLEFAGTVRSDAAGSNDRAVLHGNVDLAAGFDDGSVRVFQVWFVGLLEETVTDKPGPIERLECGRVFRPKYLYLHGGM